MQWVASVPAHPSAVQQNALGARAMQAHAVPAMAGRHCQKSCSSTSSGGQITWPQVTVCPYAVCPGLYMECGAQLTPYADIDGQERWQCRACDFITYGVSQTPQVKLALEVEELAPPPACRQAGRCKEASNAQDAAQACATDCAVPLAAEPCSSSCDSESLATRVVGQQAAGCNCSKGLESPQKSMQAACADSEPADVRNSPSVAVQSRESQSPQSALNAVRGSPIRSLSKEAASEQAIDSPPKQHGVLAAQLGSGVHEEPHAADLHQAVLVVRPLSDAKIAVQRAGGVAAIMQRAAPACFAHALAASPNEVRLPLAMHDEVNSRLRAAGLHNEECTAVPRWVLDSVRGTTLRAAAAEVDAALARMPPELRHSLMPFQLDGVRFGLERFTRCLIGDEMGASAALL